jgi:cell division protein FtsI/penicillin-binding protein 2
MIDPIQLPILMKAIDFVFEEGRKILEERRERRKAQENPPKAEIQEPAQETVAVEVQENEQTKQQLLASKIDEILWKNHEMEIQHLVRLLETYSRNYQLAREQYAKWGSALVPPIIVNNLDEAESSLLETIEKLEGVLSKVYERDIHPATT